LIVDDRRDIRYLSKHIIVKAGGRVTEAEDGLLAIESVKQATESGDIFDLILLDMQMPNMDGYQTARRLRQLGYDGPIIAWTFDRRCHAG
jgi:two-component system, chemotaxis family, CheB/CheR fusion protein